MRFPVLILILLVILITPSTRAATVTGDVRQVSIAAADAHYAQFTPARPQTVGGAVYIGAPVTLELTNGILATRLIGAIYTLKFLPVGGTITNIAVPADDGTYNLASLITNLPTYSYTNPALSRITAHVIPGTNIVAWTNNAGLPSEQLVLNASSSGGGSGDVTTAQLNNSSNVLRTAQIDSTNTLNTSLRSALAQTNAIALTNGSNVFYWNAADGTWYSPNPVTLADLSGEGSGLTNLNADYISFGTLAEARIASTLARDSEVADATNSLNTTLRAALAQTNITSANVTTALGYHPQLGSANLTNWSGVSVFATNGLTGFDAINLTNLQAAQITGVLPMGTVAAGLTNIAGPMMTSNTASRYYSYNGGALTNLSAGNLVSGTNTASVGVGTVVVSGTTFAAATTNSGNIVTTGGGVFALGASMPQNGFIQAGYGIVCGGFGYGDNASVWFGVNAVTRTGPYIAGRSANQLWFNANSNNFSGSIGATTTITATNGFVAPPVTVGASFAITNNPGVLVAANSLTITLPSAVTNAGKYVWIKNKNATTTTVARVGTETIDGGTSVTLSSAYSGGTFISDGTNWFREYAP